MQPPKQPSMKRRKPDYGGPERAAENTTPTTATPQEVKEESKAAASDIPCFMCEKAGVGDDCSGKRPCERCQQLGVPAVCMGREISSATGSSAAVSRSARGAQQEVFSLMQKQKEHQYKQSAKTGGAAASSSSASAATRALGNMFGREQPYLPFGGYSDSSANSALSTSLRGQFSEAALSASSGANLKPERASPPSSRPQGDNDGVVIEELSPELSPDSEMGGMYDGMNTPSRDPAYQWRRANGEDSTNRRKPEKGPDLDQQMIINGTLMREIHHLRQQQAAMAEEMLTLKMQNLGLNSKVEQWSSVLKTLMDAPPHQLGVSPVSGGGSYGSSQVIVGSPATRLASLNGTLGQQAMAVMDLTRQPAVVLTCNDTFARLLGWDVASQVMGMEWVRFIHPDQLRRTLRILSERTPENNTARFPQVYVERGGGLFFTQDTHNIFFDNGRPVSDLVFVTLSSNESQEAQARMLGTFHPSSGGPRSTDPSSTAAAYNVRADSSWHPTTTGFQPSATSEATQSAQQQPTTASAAAASRPVARSQDYAHYFSPSTVRRQSEELARQHAQQATQSEVYDDVWNELPDLDSFGRVTDADDLSPEPGDVFGLGLDGPLSEQDVQSLLADTQDFQSLHDMVVPTPDGNMAWGDVMAAPYIPGTTAPPGNLDLGNPPTLLQQPQQQQQ